MKCEFTTDENNKLKCIISEPTDNSYNLTLLSYILDSEEKIEAFAEFLKGNPTLKILDLSHNYIGAKGAKALAEFLKDNCTLETLNLLYNFIEGEGAADIAKALEVNSTLTTLNLSSNN